MALLQRINSSLHRNGSEREAPVASGLRSAGEDLRRQREAFKLELENAEAALKIKRQYLAAIEEGRTELLPGPVYAIGFVRAYSAYLGLDSAEILRRFKLEASGFDAKPALAFPLPLAEQSMPGRGMLVAGLVSAICAYAAWYYWSAADRVIPARVIDVPAGLSPGEAGGTKSLASAKASAPSSTRGPEGGSSAAPSAGSTAPLLPVSPTSPPAVPTAALSAVSRTNPTMGQNTVAAGAAPTVPSVSPAAPGPQRPPEPKDAATSEPPPAGLQFPSRPADAPIAAVENAASVEPVAAANPRPVAPAVPAPAEPVATVAAAPNLAATAPASSPAALKEAAKSPSGNPMQAVAAPPPAAETHLARTLGAADESSKIVLRATAESWIQIRNADHTVLYTGVLKPGDVYRVPDRPGLVMRAGNAGGLDLLVNGKPAPPLGPLGAVRNVVLDPQSLTAATAARN